MQKTFKAAASAFCAWALLAGPSWGAKFDSKALAKHISKSFSLPAGVEIEVKDVKPASVHGFLSGDVEFRFQGRTQNQPILVTEDGKYYALGEFYPLKPSMIHGLLGPSDDDPNAPKVYMTEDKKYFLTGEFHDLTVDPDAANQAKINLDNVPFRGSPSASVTLVEYSDLECPYCKSAHLALEKQLLDTYGKKIRWVFKYFPLTNIHPWAYNAAIAAACASQQKPQAEWTLEKAFFEKQGDITPANIREKAVEIVKEAGVDAGKFEACYDHQGSKSRVEADMEEARALKVDSTPTFFVNGRMVKGFRDFDAMKAVIDEMLAGKPSPKKQTN